MPCCEPSGSRSRCASCTSPCRPPSRVALGVALGVVASILASPLLPRGLARRAEVDRGIHVDPLALGRGVAVTVAVLAVIVIATSVISMRRAQSAGSPDAGTSTVASSRGRCLGASVAVVSGLRLAVDPGRGPRATPVRAAMGAAALGALGVLGTIVFASSLTHAIDTPSVYGWGWDATLARSRWRSDQR